jgi:SAM-dependent methyltransferase
MKPFADHFSRLASEYATCRPGYPSELFAYLADLAPARDLAWDCAAGTGQATLPLSRWFRRVVGTDASAEMVAQAQSDPRIEYRVAPAEQSGLEPESVDLVTVAQALHWLELGPFYEEVERVLVPGGVLAVWTYGVTRLEDDVLDGIVSRFYSKVVGPYWPTERRHVESGYRTLPFPYVELLPPAFAMRVEWSVEELAGYIRTWSATKRYLETVGNDPVNQLETQMRPLWGDPQSKKTVSWPLSLRVGRKG